MKIQKLLFFTILLAVLWATDIFDLPLTARQAALANSFTAHPLTSFSTIANPAVLTTISQNEFEILQNKNNELANYYYSGLLLKNTFAPLGINYVQLRVDDIQETAGLNSEGEVDILGELSYQTTIFTIGSGVNLTKKISLGMNYKHLQADLSANYPQAKGYSLSTGFLMDYDDFRLGLTIDNFFSQIKYAQRKEELPLIIKTGLFKDFQRFTLIFEYQVAENSLIKTAIIYRLTKTIELLGGLQQKRFCLGTSYKFNNIHLDYAYVTKANRYEDDQTNVSLRVNW